MDKRSSLNLDILRGAAALIVVFHHLFIWAKCFDKSYWYWDYVNYQFPGHLALLLFFILSGYVICYNHPVMNNRQMVTDYIRKRLVRILPIYFIAVLFCIAISWGHYSWGVMLSNLFFMSVPFDNVMTEGNPLWSVNYELLYYFVFIFFAWFNISLKKTLSFLLLLILALFLFFFHKKIPPLFISYLVGFIFWISGALIAKISSRQYHPLKSSRILAVFILLFCIGAFNPYDAVLKAIHITPADYSAWSWYQQAITYSDLFYYPFALFLMLVLTHAYHKKYRIFAIAVFMLSLFQFAFIYKDTYPDFKSIHLLYPIPSVLLVVAVLLWIFNFYLPVRIKKTASVLRMA